MQGALLQFLTIAYGLVGVVGALAYWPTLKDLYIHKKPSANTRSYAVWTITTGVAFLYGLFVLDDMLFRAISGMHFLACTTVLLLSVRLASSAASAQE